MAVSNIFSVGGQGSSASFWKAPAAATTDAQNAVFQPKKAQAGQAPTNEGKLAQALSGVAADMYSLLDTKGKETLDSIVSSGLMKVGEVELGLRALATDGLFNRYAQERPRDDEDADMQRVNQQQREAFKAQGARMGEIRGEYMQVVEKAMALLDKKEIDTDGFQAMVREPQKKMDAQLVELRQEQDRMMADNPYGDIVNYAFQKNINGFNAAISGMTGDGLLMEFASKEYAGAGVEAKNRLLDAFASVHGEKDGDNPLEKMAKTYVFAVDLPGVGANGPSLAALFPESGGGALAAAARGETPATKTADSKLATLLDALKAGTGGVKIDA